MSGDQTAELKEAISSAEAKSLCNNLLITTSELITLLDEETQLLRKANTDELSSLTIRKDALTATLSHHMEKFRSHANEMKSMVPEELLSLEEQRMQFQKSIESNHAALIAMQAVSERILQTVSDKVSAKQNGPSVYTPGGQMTTAGTKRSAAINIDTAL